MRKINSLSIIVPIHNEEANIENLDREIKQTIKELGITCETIYVNDGSTDKSRIVLEELSNVVVVNLTRNFGQSAAMAAGIEVASFEMVTFLDGDGQNPPSEISKLLSKFQSSECDLVCGWRKNRKDKLFKRFISFGARKLRMAIFRDKIHDSGCTLKLLSREHARDLKLIGEMHRFIPIIATANGLQLAEVEVVHRNREFGKTKYNWRRIFKSYLDMMGLKFWNKYAFRPLHIFGAIGLILLSTAMLCSFFWIYLYFIGSTFLKIALPMVISLLVVSSIQMILIGLLADKLIKNELQMLGESGYKIKNLVRN